LRWSGNLGVFLTGMLLGRIVLPVGVVGFGVFVDQRGWGLLNLAALPFWLELPLTVLLLDLAIWAQHLVFHRVGWLWRLHRMHHADTHLDLTSGLRFHPLEIFISIGFKLAAIALLGASGLAVFVFAILLNSGAMITHANWKLPTGLDHALRWLLVTPAMHRIHHSAERIDTDSNYGFNLAIWDRLFGTYRPAPVHGDDGVRIGLAEFRATREQGLDRLLTQPFRNPADDIEDPAGQSRP
jgi:sterol desaturase/sphingolipid hydroxylase (fatty acid hydroxylase superfamily)